MLVHETVAKGLRKLLDTSISVDDDGRNEEEALDKATTDDEDDHTNKETNL